MTKKGLILAASLLCLQVGGMALGGCRHIMPFSEDVATSGTVSEADSVSSGVRIPFKSRPRDSGEDEHIARADTDTLSDDKLSDNESPDSDPIPASVSENGADDQGDETLRQARRLAAMYDYDQAIALLQERADDPKYAEAIAQIGAARDSCVSWGPEQVTHVFYHTLIKDTALAFDGDEDTAGYDQVMTTISEFNAITQSMYEKGFVMVSLEDLAAKDAAGNMVPGEIRLPPDKKPFVLSQDDVSYYHYMDGDGMASRLVVDENGQVKTEYIETDGSVSVGDFDMVPLIDAFVEEHPDFSYRGAKGIIALTGYEGVLGYRTDGVYKTRQELDELQQVYLNAHPDFNWDEEVARATETATAMKENGWAFASHTWGHINVGESSLERLKTDTEKWLTYVAPIIGGSDKIIFAFGADLSGAEGYSGEKFDYLKSQGFDYYCNVDSSQYWVQLAPNYLRMGRRNLDGYRMYYNPELVADLFDAKSVFDPARPTPVPEMS